LNAVNDPAGGSYYVEALTFELVKKAWEYFLSIDENDGCIVEALEKGIIQERINKSHDYRVKNAETRKDSLVGTSVFANLQEKPLVRDKKKKEKESHDKALPSRRLSESFEELRHNVEKMIPHPEVFVVNIGKTRLNKPRVDFCLGFFEPAGFICKTDDGYECLETALQNAIESEAKIIVLSSKE
jgi:methylmalonyl-CoA mutase